jgi:hypothetical protein
MMDDLPEDLLVLPRQTSRRSYLRRAADTEAEFLAKAESFVAHAAVRDSQGVDYGESVSSRDTPPRRT